jgi:hypothetical protein
VNKKRAAIERKGLPGFRNWRFITLTLDREQFEGCPLSGYLAGKDRMRRFLKMCRDAGLWAQDEKWAWKMEFQSDGWSHWHLLVGRTRRFTEAEMKQISRFWSLGRVSVERVRVDDFLYSFKYAFKAAFQVEDDEFGQNGQQVAPSWFLDYYAEKPVTVTWTGDDGAPRSALAKKGVSFSRVRFWQTSKGFYTGTPPARSESHEQVSWSIPQPVRVAADRLERSVQVVSRNCGGEYQASGVFTLSCTSADFWNLVGWHTIHGAAVGLGVNSYCIPDFVLKSKLNNTCHLQSLLQQNRMSFRAAERLQQARESLRTC